MASFPAFVSQGESPSLYKPDWEDNTRSADTDGGYEFRRRRFTRERRRIITTGFISLLHNDYVILEAFWKLHQKDTAFTYYDYIMGTYHQVRFDEFKPDYVGIGANRKWTVTIKMSEI